MTRPFSALVIEDDSSWQQILAEILSDMDLLVDTAGNLEEALQSLKSEPHRLAIVDLSLAGADHHNNDGLRVLEAVRRLDPGCQTILLTGFATVELAVSVLTEYGAFTFLRKESFHRSEFRDLINRALASAPLPETSPVGPMATIRSQDSQIGGESSGDRVLIAEDDAGWRSILSELVQDTGREVRVCSSYGEALGCLRREKFILAVIDLSLTNEILWEEGRSTEQMEGYRLLADTKAAGIPTIVVSGVASVDDIQRAYAEHSIFAYIEKQAFERVSFCQLIEEACGAHQHTLDAFTEREKEVFVLLANGLTNKEIAESLFITTNTVKRHLKSIFEKLGVHTRSAALAKAATRGAISVFTPPHQTDS